jgi:hypothetical protein
MPLNNHCVRTAIICVLGARPRSSCGAVGEHTALLRRPYGVPTARISERVLTARTLCMLKVRAVAWRSRRPHRVQLRCHGAPRRSPFLRTPRDRREDASLVRLQFNNPRKFPNCHSQVNNDVLCLFKCMACYACWCYFNLWVPLDDITLCIYITLTNLCWLLFLIEKFLIQTRRQTQ